MEMSLPMESTPQIWDGMEWKTLYQIINPNKNNLVFILITIEGSILYILTVILLATYQYQTIVFLSLRGSSWLNLPSFFCI